MTRGLRALLVGLVLGVFLAPAAVAEDEPRDELLREKLRAHHTPLGIHWDDGMYFVDRPKTFTMRINYRLDLDYAGIDDDAYVAAGGRVGNTPSGMDLRRARFTVAGTLGKHSHWKVSLEATSNTGALRDNYLDTELLKAWWGRKLPHVRLGNFFEPFSLEQTTPSGRLTFMERAGPTQAIAPGRSLGAGVYDTLPGGRVGYAAGLFVSGITEVGGLLDRLHDDTLVSDGWGITGRFWWTPINDCRCACRRLQLGLSLSHRVGISQLTYRTRPESYSFEHVVDTDFSTDASGSPLLDDTTAASLAGMEASWVEGRWFAQGELFATHAQSDAGGDPSFWGGYVFVGCWLTGECRRLGDGQVLPNKICRPLDPCTDDGGVGGVEIAARFSTLDLDDGNIAGGRMNVLSLELNWHFKAQRRLMFNFVRAHVNDGIANEPIYVFQTRLQLVF